MDDRWPQQHSQQHQPRSRDREASNRTRILLWADRRRRRTPAHQSHWCAATRPPCWAVGLDGGRCAATERRRGQSVAGYTDRSNVYRYLMRACISEPPSDCCCYCCDFAVHCHLRRRRVLGALWAIHVAERAAAPST